MVFLTVRVVCHQHSTAYRRRFGTYAVRPVAAESTRVRHSCNTFGECWRNWWLGHIYRCKVCLQLIRRRQVDGGGCAGPFRCVVAWRYRSLLITVATASDGVYGRRGLSDAGAVSGFAAAATPKGIWATGARGRAVTGTTTPNGDGGRRDTRAEGFLEVVCASAAGATRGSLMTRRRRGRGNLGQEVARRCRLVRCLQLL